jgi:hypothetical protein
MTVILDIAFAAVLLGMIILTVMNVNINMSQENWKGMAELHTQTETIQLARILEFDLYKVGYRVPVALRPAITVADSTHLRFRTNLADKAGAVDVVEYGLGGIVANSKNPRDMMLFRVENISKVYINYSVVQFKLSYYNEKDSLMPAPVTGSALGDIRAIKVILRLESPEPFDTTWSGGNQYASAMYQKVIYPRNL